MALSSQQPRDNARDVGGFFLSRALRPSRRWLWIVLVVFVAALVLYKTWPDRGNAGPVPDGSQEQSQLETASADGDDQSPTGADVVASGQTHDADAQPSLGAITSERTRQTPREKKSADLVSAAQSLDDAASANRAPRADQTTASQPPTNTDMALARVEDVAPSIPPTVLRVSHPQVGGPAAADAAAHEPARYEPANSHVNAALQLIDDSRYVEARDVLNDLLIAGGLADTEDLSVRGLIEKLNDEHLLFTRYVVQGDPLAAWYKIEPGDYLIKIAPKYHITHDLVAAINQVDPRRIRAGKSLKVVQGPFHAHVIRSRYRLDVYLDDRDGQRVFIRSYPVGLGSNDSTPVGNWKVSLKHENPDWRDPASGRYYPPDDPENPLGEYWIRLQGLDPANREYEGYGVHGTIEPQSIGKQVSMGCIRMLPDDVAMLYKLLAVNHSTVVITD